MEYLEHPQKVLLGKQGYHFETLINRSSKDSKVSYYYAIPISVPSHTQLPIFQHPFEPSNVCSLFLNNCVFVLK